VNEKEEERKKNNGVNSGHYVLHQRVQRQPLAHALRSDQLIIFPLHAVFSIYFINSLVFCIYLYIQHQEVYVPKYI
jgi:hypothetical protein